ncbi:MAG: PDZ domain-containing protein, partial [Planctomycetaceae bacterium]
MPHLFVAVALLSTGLNSRVSAADPVPAKSATESAGQDPAPVPPAVDAKSDNPRPASATKPMGAPPSPESIAGWIADLDNDQFTIRQEATRRLSEAGVSAIEPLMRAATAGSLETTTRALTILEDYYTSPDPDAHAAADAAEESLEKIVSEKNVAAAKRAEYVLASHDGVREARAVERIRALGGIVKYSREDVRNFVRGPIGNPPTPGILYVALPREWKGGDDGLKYLRRLKYLPMVYRISGDHVSDQAVNALKAVHPDIRIEPRGAATLGIEADNSSDTQCLVKDVTPNSAAQKGGIRPGDVIKTFNGQ